MRNRLYRSRSDRMLFGVAGGMAEWLDIDRKYLPAFDTGWVVPAMLIVLGIVLVAGALARSRNPGER